MNDQLTEIISILGYRRPDRCRTNLQKLLATLGDEFAWNMTDDGGVEITSGGLTKVTICLAPGPMLDGYVRICAFGEEAYCSPVSRYKYNIDFNIDKILIFQASYASLVA